MAEHPNVALLRKGYEAFAKGDMATLTQQWSEDMVWHWSGNTPFSGDHKGRDAVFRVLARYRELSGGTARVDLHDILANDEHAVALTRGMVSRQGKDLNVLETYVYHVSNGKVTEVWMFSEDQRLNDEFWS